jgi:hypothetical protein
VYDEATALFLLIGVVKPKVIVISIDKNIQTTYRIERAIDNNKIRAKRLF